ncbi:M1 family aminopeptidase [Chitinophaga sp. HK235]|uniref:M1 family aminopeptidase n=1 Tax=Chitinophaga sp. HK235 TaxID=2952571 RepID=UPI001BA5E825|nr:M1 family aminopeptidase [Chitinophaga sp. HK235]
MRRLITLVCLLSSGLLAAQQKLDYQLQLQVDPEKKIFAVQGSLTFETSASSADSVTIVISKGKGTTQLQLRGIAATMYTSTNSSGDIAYHWRFKHSLPAGTSLYFSYAYDRGDAPSFQFYLDSSFCMAGGYGSAWYPQVMSRAEDGTDNYTRGTGTLRVTTPQHLMPVMAASTFKTTTAPLAQTFEFHYAQPDIFSLYIGNYTRQEYQGRLPFYTYCLSKTINGSDISRKAASVLDYLSGEFGPLAIPNFSIIEFPEKVSELTGIGGASILGGVVMPTGALREFNYALFGHEIGHQWWGNKILSKGSAGADLLSEGMAQYGSLQVVQHFDSTHAVDYRKTGYPGYLRDQSGLGYLKNAAAGNDEPLVALTGSNGHILGDSKGFLALELLSNITGKQVFHKALRNIGEKYSHDGLTWKNFLQEISTAYGSSLEWFYQQWFERTGVPAWQSSWQQQNNTLQLTLTQKDSIYRLPLEVLITYRNGTIALQHITIQEHTTQLQLPVNGPVTTVQIDPYFKVLHWDDSLTPIAIAQSKVIQVLNLRIQQKPEEAMALAKSYLQAGIPGDHYGVEFSLYYQLGRITATQNKPDEALAYYQHALQSVSRAPELLAYTYYRIAQLASAKNDTTLLQWACNNAITADEANQKADGMEAKTMLLRK